MTLNDYDMQHKKGSIFNMWARNAQISIDFINSVNITLVSGFSDPYLFFSSFFIFSCIFQFIFCPLFGALVKLVPPIEHCGIKNGETNALLEHELFTLDKFLFKICLRR